MKKQPTRPPPVADLRSRAEARLRARSVDTDAAQTHADTQRLVHELQVHQIELEMQNEELQRAHATLQAGLEKYTDLYDFAPVGYLTLDWAGTILEANLAAASLLGIERSRLLKQRFGTHVAVGDRTAFSSLLDKVHFDRIRGFCELILVPDSGPPIATRIDLDLGASGRECRVVLVDISSHRRAEENRLTLNKLESTGILAGGIAHDFNNLLTVILLDIERAQSRAVTGEVAARPLAEARKAALSAQSLTQQLITFSRGGAPVRKPTQLTGVIEESVRLPLSGSRVRCELTLAPNLWSGNVDEGQIGQVVRNLVLNARESMPAGGVITVQAENAVVGSGENPQLPPGDYVRLRVSDQGCGMAEDVRAKIFDPYFSTKQRGAEKGTGLGLTICHSIIQKHGGAVAVASKVGVGTTFLVHLPACGDGAGEMKPALTVVAPASARILVMDDEDPVRNVIGLALRHMGHEVELVSDGQAAIDLYRKASDTGRPFDLVFLDLTVRAGLGGQEAMVALRKFDPGVKGIVMSGYADHTTVREPERHGFVGVLPKPFDGGKLRAVVARIMGSERERRSAS